MKRNILLIMTILPLLLTSCCKPGSETRDYVKITNLCLQNYGEWWSRSIYPNRFYATGYYLGDSLVKDSITVNRALFFTCDGYWYYTMLDKIFMQKNDSSCFCWNADYNPKENCLHPGSNFKKENFKYWTEDNGKILVLQACGYPSQNDTVPRLFQMRFKANLYMKKKPCRCYDIGTLYLSPINQEAVLFTKNATTDTTATKVELFLVNQDCLE